MSFRITGHLASRIASLVREGSVWPDGKLPTVRALAQSFGTSPVTMNRVLKRLATEGLIGPLPGRDGYWVRGSTPAEPVLPRACAGDLAESTAERMLGDILQGILPSDHLLPTCKELCRRYGCHYSTLKRALVSLLERGILVSRGRRYAYRQTGALLRHGTDAYLAGTARVLRSSTQNIFAVVNALERGLESAGWRRTRLAVTEEQRRDLLADPRRVAALVFSVKQELLSLAAACAGRTLVGLAPGGMSAQTEKDLRFVAPDCFVIETDNRSVGRTVGLALAELGHRHIAFVGDLEPGSEVWLSRRIEGLREIFRDVARKGAGRSMRLACGRPVNGGGDPENRGLHQQIVRARLHALRLDRTPRHTATSEAFGPAFEFQSCLYRAGRLEPVFEELLGDREITAWVCLNDAVATMALTFLTKRKIQVPEFLSLVGFDNTFNSWEFGLGTYDFAYDRMGQLAAQAIVNPSNVRGRFGRHALVAGQIIPRSSIGRRRG